MSRATDPSEYVLRVDLKDGSDVRRFCEVRVKGKDVYIHQPRKGESVKVSYHESGQKRVRIGQSGPIMPPMHLDSVGRSFDPEGWSMDGVDQVTLKQEVFLVPHSTDGLQGCVRLLQLQSSSAPSPPSEHPE
jgi:hypothetical protein